MNRDRSLWLVVAASCGIVLMLIGGGIALTLFLRG